MKRLLILVFVLFTGTIHAQSPTHKDRIGLVAPMNSYDLLKTGIRFKAGPIWWNPVHQSETPRKDWKIEYHFVLKWTMKDGTIKGKTVKTWDPFTFWPGESNVEAIYYNVIAIPHHKFGKFTANESFGCANGIVLSNWKFDL